MEKPPQASILLILGMFCSQRTPLLPERSNRHSPGGIIPLLSAKSLWRTGCGPET